MKGVKRPADCKFPEPVTEILLLEAIEIVPVTAAAQKSIEMQMDEGFSRPASGVRSGPGGKMGARLEFVPMPTAKDYQPPKEIREELERSLREKRPAAYDGIIKDYFKRISQ